MERGRFPLSNKVRDIIIPQKLKLPDEFEVGGKTRLFPRKRHFPKSDLCDFDYLAVNQPKSKIKGKFDLKTT